MGRCIANVSIAVTETAMDALFLVLDFALSMQQHSEKLPNEKEFREVQGNPNWIYFLISFINLCHQKSWTKVKLKDLTKGEKKGNRVQNHRKSSHTEWKLAYVTDILILCKIQMSIWIKIK